MFTDMSYDLLEETAAYPLQEMVNELTGIFGLYFGVSVVSLARLLKLALGYLRRILVHKKKARMNSTNLRF